MLDERYTQVQVTEYQQNEMVGQQFKKSLYKWLIERSDQELVPSKAGNIKFIRYGNIPYSFKTIFGNVPVNRIRLKYPNNQTEILSVRAWKTPQKLFITSGLRAAVCDLIVKTSITNTQREISERTGERGLISERTVLNILHETGESLTQALEKRARKVYEEMPTAKCLIIDSSKPWRKKNLPVVGDQLWESDYEFDEMIGARVLWYWEKGKLMLNEPQRTEEEGLVSIQVDECVV